MSCLGVPFFIRATSSWWTQKGTPYGEYLINPLFISKTLLDQDEKGHPPFNSTFCFYLLRAPAIPTSPHKSTLCPMLANHFILHAQVAPISTSTLPITYVYPHHSLPIASLTDSQHAAGKRPFLGGALFTSETHLNRDKKGHPMYSNCQVAPMSTSPCKYSLPDVTQSHHLVFGQACPEGTL